jgi:antitoxin VapB
MKKKKKAAKPAVVRETAVLDDVADDTAKLFWNGRSQAVRLPRAFRFDGDEVAIRRSGDAVILEPLRAKRGWPAGYWERLGGLGDDFERAVREASDGESAAPDLGA